MPCCSAVSARGQYETAAVLGTVTDPAGLPVSVGKIRLENTLTGVSVSGVTNSSGNYQFLNVRAGTYRVSAEAAGFKQAIAETFTVAVNSRQRVDLRLEVGDVKQTVHGQGRRGPARVRFERPRPAHRPATPSSICR